MSTETTITRYQRLTAATDSLPVELDFILTPAISLRQLYERAATHLWFHDHGNPARMHSLTAARLREWVEEVRKA